MKENTRINCGTVDVKRLLKDRSDRRARVLCQSTKYYLRIKQVT